MKNIDIDKIAVPNKVSFDKKGYKHFMAITILKLDLHVYFSQK